MVLKTVEFAIIHGNIQSLNSSCLSLSMSLVMSCNGSDLFVHTNNNLLEYPNGLLQQTA